MLPLKYNKVSAWDAHRRATKVLEMVDMRQRLQHLPTELSGGEQQRVAIARALISSPLVILADEPTGELDTQSATDILNLMKGLNQELKQTFVIVTHDPMVGRVASRVIEMKDGTIGSDTRSEDV